MIYMEYSAIKRNEILPFATTWMDLEGIVPSEISSDRERQILYGITYSTYGIIYSTYVEFKSYRKLVNITKRK